MCPLPCASPAAPGRRADFPVAASPGLAGTAHATPARRLDPRLYQIAVLAGLLAYGMVRLEFEIGPGRVFAILAAAELLRVWIEELDRAEIGSGAGTDLASA